MFLLLPKKMVTGIVNKMKKTDIFSLFVFNR